MFREVDVHISDRFHFWVERNELFLNMDTEKTKNQTLPSQLTLFLFIYFLLNPDGL